MPCLDVCWQVSDCGLQDSRKNPKASLPPPLWLSRRSNPSRGLPSSLLSLLDVPAPLHHCCCLLKSPINLSIWLSRFQRFGFSTEFKIFLEMFPMFWIGRFSMLDLTNKTLKGCCLTTTWCVNISKVLPTAKDYLPQGEVPWILILLVRKHNSRAVIFNICRLTALWGISLASGQHSQVL